MCFNGKTVIFHNILISFYYRYTVEEFLLEDWRLPELINLRVCKLEVCSFNKVFFLPFFVVYLTCSLQSPFMRSMQLQHPLRETRTLVLPLLRLIVRPSRLIGGKLTGCTVAMDLNGGPFN